MRHNLELLMVNLFMLLNQTILFRKLIYLPRLGIQSEQALLLGTYSPQSILHPAAVVAGKQRVALQFSYKTIYLPSTEILLFEVFLNLMEVEPTSCTLVLLLH